MEARGWEPMRPAPEAVSRGDADLDTLLVLAGHGDQPAFEAVYDRVAAPVFGLIRRVLRDFAQAEEVAQEVLLEVWRTAGRFDPARGTAATWVMTIAHRRAVDRVRSAVAASERETRAASAPHSMSADEIAEAAASSLEAERVRRCLNGLSQLQRQSITLAYYSGYSCPQVASALGVSLGTAKSRIRDGLRRLRECMEGRW